MKYVRNSLIYDTAKAKRMADSRKPCVVRVEGDEEITVGELAHLISKTINGNWFIETEGVIYPEYEDDFSIEDFHCCPEFEPLSDEMAMEILLSWGKDDIVSEHFPWVDEA